MPTIPPEKGVPQAPDTPSRRRQRTPPAGLDPQLYRELLEIKRAFYRGIEQRRDELQRRIAELQAELNALPPAPPCDTCASIQGYVDAVLRDRATAKDWREGIGVEDVANEISHSEKTVRLHVQKHLGYGTYRIFRLERRHRALNPPVP